MTEIPKPCPFCGRPAHRITPMGFWEVGKGYGPSGVRYVCSSLYVEPMKLCPGSEPFYGENAEVEALAAWNTRAYPELEAKLAKAIEALHFYADFYEVPNDGPWGAFSEDFGRTASNALLELKESK